MKCYYRLFSCSDVVAANTPFAYLTHNRFCLASEVYSQGKFLTIAAQHRSSPKSAQYVRAGIRTHAYVVGYLFWLWAASHAVPVRTTQDGYDQCTANVSKVAVYASIACKSSYKPQQPQPFSNISLPLARDYSASKK